MSVLTCEVRHVPEPSAGGHVEPAESAAHAPGLSGRLPDFLDHGRASIDEVLVRRGAVAESHHLTAGASGGRTAYRIDGGRRRVHVEWIRLYE
ncbi:hypothetical protein PWG71_27050 [Nocardiopsis sp. N85]|uniref:hypothetical protein n=1 Tax=Nocardiopsis sp. N85 TaxID=3029400 RepID=UPI00237F0A5F|nr:hypothetical protein [Nocardiopsis sp. N85]MDE3725056.1 hypothetical protein [Nocardiopsis sp. N85]